MKIAILKNLTEDEKMQITKFVFKNTDSFIMNTFGYIWSERNWWNKFPIELCVDNNNKILGLHAYTVYDKYPDCLKTYYIVTNKDYRGKGIAKALIKNALTVHKNFIKFYYVNTDENSNGSVFYKKWLGNNYEKSENEFNSNDLIFKEPIYNIIDEKAKNNR